MNKLKSKLGLKIKIPMNREEECKISIEDNKNTISKIKDNIYISGYLIANDIDYLLNNKFTHIINCSYGSSLISHNQQNNISSTTNYLLINLRDDPSDDIIEKILKVINFVGDNSKNKKILFHCVEGVSRGPALAAGYLMWKNNMTKSEAINLISSKRKCIDINLGFSIQLNKWEKYLNNFENKINQLNINKHDEIFFLENKKSIELEEGIIDEVNDLKVNFE